MALPGDRYVPTYFQGCGHEYIPNELATVEYYEKLLQKDSRYYLPDPQFCPKCARERAAVMAKRGNKEWYHLACRHQYTGDKDAPGLRCDECDDGDVPLIRVLHPRWCQTCIVSRSAALQKMKFTAMQSPPAHLERGWKEGVRRGRIEAQSLDFDWSTASGLEQIEIAQGPNRFFTRQDVQADPDLWPILRNFTDIELFSAFGGASGLTGRDKFAELLKPETLSKETSFIIYKIWRQYREGTLAGRYKQWEWEQQACNGLYSREDKDRLLQEALTQTIQFVNPAKPGYWLAEAVK